MSSRPSTSSSSSKHHRSSSSKKPNGTSRPATNSNGVRSPTSDGGTSLKATTLRFLHAPGSHPNKDIVCGNSKTEKELTLKLATSPNDTVIEEQATNGVITLVRFRNLSNPPPALPLPVYAHVATLHVSCVFPIRWMFSHFSGMPELRNVAFGTGCFAEDKYVFKDQTMLKLEASSSVKDLNIRVDVYKHANCLDPIVKHRITTIFTSAATCCKELTSVDFTIPMNTEEALAEFRTKLSQFQKIGLESRDLDRHYMTFKASVNHHGPAPSSSKRPSTSSDEGVGHKKAKEDDCEVIYVSDDEPEDLELTQQIPASVISPPPPPLQAQNVEQPPPKTQQADPPPSTRQLANQQTHVNPPPQLPNRPLQHPNPTPPAVRQQNVDPPPANIQQNVDPPPAMRQQKVDPPPAVRQQSAVVPPPTTVRPHYAGDPPAVPPPRRHTEDPPPSVAPPRRHSGSTPSSHQVIQQNIKPIMPNTAKTKFIVGGPIVEQSGVDITVPVRPMLDPRTLPREERRTRQRSSRVPSGTPRSPLPISIPQREPSVRISNRACPASAKARMAQAMAAKRERASSPSLLGEND